MRHWDFSLPVPPSDLPALKQPLITDWFQPLFCATLNFWSHKSSPPNDKPNQVLFDSGANCCITNQIEDFRGTLKTSDTTRIVDGIGKGLNIDGHGTAFWTFTADNGKPRTIKVPCLYVPSSSTRIASIQVVLRAYPKEQVSITNSGLKLSAHKSVSSLTVPLHSAANLPMGTTLPQPEVNAALDVHSHSPSLTRDANLNLSDPEKEMLRWHCRLGHINMRRVQWLMRNSLLSSSTFTRRLHQQAASLKCGPMCAACQFAKQRRKTNPGHFKKTDKSKENALKTEDLFPGSRISVDHFTCNPKGRFKRISSWSK